MASTNLERIETARRFESARVKADRSVAWLARKAGMSASALRRKLDGEVDFYIWEAARLAEALDRKVSEFLPAAWSPDVTADASTVKAA